MSRTAIIAGTGALPAILAARLPDALVHALPGFAPEGVAAQEFRLERLVPFLDSLVDQGVRDVTFAGAIRRPRLDPSLFDPRTASMVPRILTAMQQGDDAALREVIAIFEEWGLHVVATAQIAPDLVPGPGVLCGKPSDADRQDAERAALIVETLGPLDVGQGAVVAGGLCLAIETLPGTDAMLNFVATHQDCKTAKGVLYKAPKPGQDRRIDLPAIGPDTVALAAAAGLAGIAWAANGVLLLERDATLVAAESAGLFLWAR